MKAIELKELEEAIIISIDMKSEDATRLFYLGMYPGAHIKLVRRAPLHDPFVFSVQGGYLILRRENASLIEVQPL